MDAVEGQRSLFRVCSSGAKPRTSSAQPFVPLLPPPPRSLPVDTSFHAHRHRLPCHGLPTRVYAASSESRPSDLRTPGALHSHHGGPLRAGTRTSTTGHSLFLSGSSLTSAGPLSCPEHALWSYKFSHTCLYEMFFSPPFLLAGNQTFASGIQPFSDPS